MTAGSEPSRLLAEVDGPLDKVAASPDGIYLMNPDGTGQSRVHRTDGNVVALHWFP